MVRIFFCMLLIFSSTLVGNWFSVRTSRRRRNIFVLIEALEKMKNYISFGGYEIRSVIKRSFSFAEGFEIISSDENVEDDLQLWWGERVRKLINTTALNSEDIEILEKFGNNLGITDVEGQTANCELYINLFSKRLKSAENSEHKNFRLYRILGFSFGCVVTLMVL